MIFAYGPLKEIPKFSVGIGEAVEFFPCTEKIEEGFTKIGELLVYGSAVYSNTVYMKDELYYLK